MGLRSDPTINGVLSSIELRYAVLHGIRSLAMDVAFGVIGTAGIALHSARRVYELVTDIRGAPESVKNVSCDVKALSNALEVLQAMLQDFRQPEQLKVVPMLQMPLDSCVETLHGIEIKIKPHIKIQQGKLKIWKGFIWSFREKEILLMQSTLLAHKQSLDIAINIANLFAIIPTLRVLLTLFVRSSNVALGKDTKENLQGLQHKIKQLGQKLNTDRESMVDDSYIGSDSGGSDYAYNIKQWLLRAETVFEDPMAEESPREQVTTKAVKRPLDNKIDDMYEPGASYHTPRLSPEVSPDRSLASSGKPAALEQSQSQDIVNTGSEKCTLQNMDRANFDFSGANFQFSGSSPVNSAVFPGDAKHHDEFDATSLILYHVSTIHGYAYDRPLHFEDGWPHLFPEYNDILGVIREKGRSLLVKRIEIPWIIGWVATAHTRKVDVNTTMMPPLISGDDVESQIEISVKKTIDAIRLLFEKLTYWVHRQVANEEASDAYVRLIYEFRLFEGAVKFLGYDPGVFGRTLDLMRPFIKDVLSQDASPEAYRDVMIWIRQLNATVARQFHVEDYMELPVEMQLQGQRLYISQLTALNDMHRAIAIRDSNTKDRG